MASRKRQPIRATSSVSAITRGSASNDITKTETLMADNPCEHAIADRTYDSEEFLHAVLGSEAAPVVLPKSNRNALRQSVEHRFRECHLVEGLINKIKYYRRIFSRFDKLSKSYLDFLSFVGALIWLK